MNKKFKGLINKLTKLGYKGIVQWCSIEKDARRQAPYFLQILQNNEKSLEKDQEEDFVIVKPDCVEYSKS